MNFVPEKNCDWKTKNTLREFCTNQQWRDENGKPFNPSVKRKWITEMNNNQIVDIAYVTFQPGSDLIELWYTTPFVEKTIWVNIPGFHDFMEQMENDKARKYIDKIKKIKISANPQIIKSILRLSNIYLNCF